MLNISIKNDFSTTPGHRSPADGPFSGELFLETVLKPKFEEALKSNEKIFIDLDGTAGYATSFLEASFGGLARLYPIDTVLKNIIPSCNNEPYLVEEIRGYIRDARNPKKKQN